MKKIAGSKGEEHPMAAYDLCIRGGMVVDGSGAAPFAADVAVKDGVIVAVGRVDGDGETEIDAKGRIVTPGFVDIHTHYDGHVTWAERLNPSSAHGVTTVLTGNCGVGFAPCKADDRDGLVALMEGVEDIPEVVMTAGLPWNWESFPDYLDRLDARRFDMDVATQLPHAPLRLYVMGERAARREPASPEDIARMRALAAEAVDAGALGFSTSRSLNHKSNDGEVTPTYGAEADELAGIALGLKDVGKGVLQIISDFDDVDGEFAILRRMVAESGRPLSTSLMQMHHAPQRWRRVLDLIDAANRDGLSIKGQISGRPVGVMSGLDFSRNPFFYCASFAELDHLPLPERLVALRDPERRARILAEFPGVPPAGVRNPSANFAALYEFDDDPDYEPRPDECLEAKAAAAGQPAAAYVYDRMVSGEGRTVFYAPVVNYVGNSTEAIETMLNAEHVILGLGDGGAHCGMICDASLPTYMLRRWVGPGKFALEEAVRALTTGTAEAVGLYDRGRIAAGYRADLNVIDLGALSIPPPAVYYDLPDAGRRIGQDARGFDATIVAGKVTYRHGEPTGELPGRLVRGARPAPVI
jgi:N-acyl-D-aspartate/D-glutamate deacylase